MGLFSANYAKEGPGVDKNAPQKKRFFLFWELYFRKFWKLVQLNLIYVLFFIPAGVGMYYLADGLNVLSVALIIASVVLIGPATAGLTYVLRNFAREEHAFVVSDFKDNFKSNFKQAAIYNVLFTAAMTLIVLSGIFYYRNTSVSTMMYVPLVLCMGSFMILNFMNFYMYTMIVTFRLTLVQMLKNAFIFSILGLFTNLFTLIVTGAAVLLLFLFFPLTLLIIVPIALSTIWFIITFNAYPRIKKHMIDPNTENQSVDQLEEGDDAPVFSDERLIPPAAEEEDGR